LQLFCIPATTVRVTSVLFVLPGCGSDAGDVHACRAIWDRERDELRRGDPWASACTAPGRQEIVHQHVKCNEKVVEVGEHEATSVVNVARATLTFDGLPIPPGPATMAATNSESLI
jgi:hypothetical protein